MGVGLVLFHLVVQILTVSRRDGIHLLYHTNVIQMKKGTSSTQITSLEEIEHVISRRTSHYTGASEAKQTYWMPENSRANNGILIN